MTPHVMSPQERSAAYEAARVQSRKSKRPAPEYRDASTLRDLILTRLAPDNDGPFYDAQAMALVEEFEVALRDAWERHERQLVEDKACAAVRRSLEAISEGKLL